MPKYTLFLLVFFTHLVSAQKIVLSGYVADSETGYTMSYVNVVFPKTQNGNYTDEEGRFRIDVSELKTSDSVFFSHLGYEEIRTTIANVQQHSAIKLKAKNFAIGEVVVSPMSAVDLLRLAKSKIKENYPTNYSNSRFIFKDFSKRSGHKSHYYYFDLNLYLATYAGTKMQAGWKVNKHEIYDKKNEMTAQMKPTDLLDAVLLERGLTEKQLAKNDYRFLSKTTFNGEDLDVIGFTRKPDEQSKFARINGKVYIAHDTKAIRMIEIHVHNIKSKRFYLVAKMDSLNVNVKMAFKKVGDTNVIDYISQTTYAKGSLFGKKENLHYSTTAKAIAHELNIPAASVYKANDVDRIFKKEKEQSINELKEEPSMW